MNTMYLGLLPLKGERSSRRGHSIQSIQSPFIHGKCKKCIIENVVKAGHATSKSTGFGGPI